MTDVFWSNMIGNVETHIRTLEKEFSKKNNNKCMSEICFWMNSDKSMVVDMSQIIGIIKLDRPTTCRGCICEYGVYTSIEKDIAFPITKNEHLSLIEALQETYEYCEMEEDEDSEEEETNEVYNTSICSEEEPFNNRIKW
jgi:hypothetical protein